MNRKTQRHLLIPIIFFFLASISANADVLLDQALVDLKIPKDNKSIYKLELLTDAIIIGAGTLVTLGAYANSYNLIRQHCICDPDSINALDRRTVPNDNKMFDVAANYLVASALLTPIIVDYLDIGLTKSFVEDMVVYGNVLAINFGLVTISKFVTQRPYPYMYRTGGNLAGRDPSDYLSFYSSHTSTTVAALAFTAVTINQRYKQSGLWPWLVVGAAGSVIAVQLVASGEHFPTDVIVGGIMGYAIGTIVPEMRFRDQKSNEKSVQSQQTFVTPIAGGAKFIWLYSL